MRIHQCVHCYFSLGLFSLRRDEVPSNFLDGPADVKYQVTYFYGGYFGIATSCRDDGLQPFPTPDSLQKKIP
jgi:hypothetical protein